LHIITLFVNYYMLL